MKKITHTTDSGHNIVGFHAEVPFHVAPKIVGETRDKLSYKLANGRTSPKAVYDAMWNSPKTKMKPMYFKGDNPDQRKSLYGVKTSKK